MTEESNSNFNISKFVSKLKFSDALVISLVPIGAYVLIFTFYSGYFSIFGIPLQLIDFDLNFAFIVTTAIISVALAVFFWGDIAFSFSSIFPSIVAIRLRRVTIILVIAAGIYLCIITVSQFRYWKYFIVGACIFYLLIEFVPPIFLHRGKGSFIEKLNLNEQERDRRKSETDSSDTWVTPLEKLMMFLGPEIGLVGLLFLMVFGLGRYSALSQARYFVVNSDPESVILYMSSDRAIVAPFDRDNNQVIAVFEIINLDSDLNLSFYAEEIGPIRVQKEISALGVMKTSTPMPSPSPSPTCSATATSRPTRTITPTSIPTKLP